MKTTPAQRDYLRRWRLAHPDYDRNRRAKRDATTKIWNEKNPEKLKEVQRLGRLKIKERDPDYFRRNAREWNKAHPEKYKANGRASRERHKEKIRAKNRERTILCKATNAVGRTRARKYGSIWEDCASKIRFLRLLPFCQYCFTLIRRRTVDHVVALANGGAHVANNLRACCHSCNCSKNDTALRDWPGRQLVEAA